MSPSDWRVSEAIDPAQAEWAEREGYLFATAGWAAVLRALDAEPRFAWSPAPGLGIVVPVFRRATARVGFLGFPLAGAAFDSWGASDLRAAALALARDARLDVVRVNRSFASAFDPDATSARPEVWIKQLQAFTTTEHKRLRKDLALARRSQGETRLTDRCSDPGRCFELYAETVREKRGTLRYGRAYFEALRSLADASERLRWWSVIEPEGNLRAFAVLALDGPVGYYLHGGVDAAGRRQGLSDRLLERLVDDAREAGCGRFNLLASPWEQPNLVRFKKKWGRDGGLSLTYDVPNGPKGRAVAAAARWQARADRRRARAWSPDA